MKVLVTGAAGFIGSHMCERLVREGHDVIGLDAFTPYYDVRIKEANASDLTAVNVPVLRLDLSSDDLAPALSGIERVFHFAGQPGIDAGTSFDEYLRNNIIATNRLLDASEKAGVRGFVNIATSSVYGKFASSEETAEAKPTSYYGVTKLAAEQLVLARQRDKGFPALSLRIFSVYGERERPDKLVTKLASAIMSETTFPLFENAPHMVRSYSYVGDIVDGCMAAFNNLDASVGEIFNIGTDVTHTTAECIELVEEILGSKAKIETMPPRPGDQQETSAQIGKARRMLSYTPKTTLREGLQKQIAWLQKHTDILLD